MIEGSATVGVDGKTYYTLYFRAVEKLDNVASEDEEPDFRVFNAHNAIISPI